MSWTVLVTRRIPPEGLELLRKSGAKVDLHDDDAPMGRGDLLTRARDCDGLIVTGGDRCNAELFNAAPKLKVVSCFAVGYDNVDLAEATRRRIVVTNTPDVLTDACADHTWAQILSVARRVVSRSRTDRRARSTSSTTVRMERRLHRATQRISSAARSKSSIYRSLMRTRFSRLR
jgi:glyoxylate reductase